MTLSGRVWRQSVYRYDVPSAHLWLLHSSDPGIKLGIYRTRVFDQTEAAHCHSSLASRGGGVGEGQSQRRTATPGPAGCGTLGSRFWVLRLWSGPGHRSPRGNAVEAGEVGSRVTDGCVTTSRGPSDVATSAWAWTRKKHGSPVV